MVDLDGLAALYPRTALTVRAQSRQADLTGEAHVRTGVAEPDDLVEQSAGPQVRVVGEPGNDIGAVIGQGIGAARAAHAGHPFPGQPDATTKSSFRP